MQCELFVGETRRKIILCPLWTPSHTGTIRAAVQELLPGIAAGLALCSTNTTSQLAPSQPTQLIAVSLRPLEDIFWDVRLLQGTSRGYSAFVTKKVIVCGKELVKDHMDLWSDSHVVKSVPYNVPAKTLSFLLILVCFHSSDPPSSIPLKAKIYFHNCLRAPTDRQRHHCTTMPVPSPAYQTQQHPQISLNVGQLSCRYQMAVAVNPTWAVQVKEPLKAVSF